MTSRFEPEEDGVIRHIFTAAVVCVCGCVAAHSLVRVAAAQAPAPPISFAKDIRPIFQASCESCHGEPQVSGFDLRTSESALKGGDHGGDIVPGSADQSRLYRRIAGLEQPSMPKEGAALSAQQI